MSNRYTDHLSALNNIRCVLNRAKSLIQNQNLNQNQNQIEELKECALCPITYSEIDSKNLSESITIINSKQQLTSDEEEKLQKENYIFKSGTGTCSHVVVYDIDSAYEWFITRDKSDPTSRRELSQDEKSRIIFRYNMKKYYSQNPTPDIISKLFSKYVDHLKLSHIIETDLNTDEFKILKCHLTPEHLPNYMNVSREDAQSILLNALFNNDPFSWIIRPSKYKGSEFVKREDGTIHPMSEYYVITYYDQNSNQFYNHLIEKIYSCGWYTGTGSYQKSTKTNIDVLDHNRIKWYPTFFDILKSKLLDMTHCLNISNYDPSVLNVNKSNKQNQNEIQINSETKSETKLEIKDSDIVSSIIDSIVTTNNANHEKPDVIRNCSDEIDISDIMDKNG